MRVFRLPFFCLLPWLLFFAFPLVAFGQVEPAATADPGGVLAWAVENGQILLQIVGAAVLLASLIARLTPTRKDDAIVGWVKKALDYFSLGGLNRGASKPAETTG